MDNLGMGSLINSQTTDGQQFSRLLSLGMNIPTTETLTFESNIGFMPDVPVPNCTQSQIPVQNVTVESINSACISDVRDFLHEPMRDTVPNYHEPPGQVEEPTNNSEQRTFACEKCNQHFEHEDVLVEHLRCYHNVEKPFVCHICNQPDASFRQRLGLNTHLRKEHNYNIPIKKAKISKLPNGSYACDLCDATFQRMNKAYSHRLRHFHKRHACIHCQKTFFEYKFLRKHLLTHEKTNLNSLNTPGKNEKTGLQKAKLMGPLVCKKTVFCKFCSKGYHNNYAMNLHVKISHENIKPFKCILCSDQAFCSKISLQKHMFKKHNIQPPKKRMNRKVASNSTADNTNDGKSHLCEYCSATFSSRYQFRLHLASHNFKDSAHLCFLCQEGFCDKENLNSHLRQVHELGDSNLTTPEKTDGHYKCQQCEETFEKAHSFYEHRLKVHSDARFICPYCKKGYTKTTVFRNHLHIHTRNKPHVCLVCEVGFANRTNLILHQKTHWRQHKYYCGVCNNVFETEEIFIQHGEKHQGESEFPCGKCYKGFDNNEDLQKHLTWGHRKLERKFHCKYCKHSFVSKTTLNKHMNDYCEGIEKPTRERNICQFCQKSYKHFYTLRTHLKSCELNVNKESLEPLDPNFRSARKSAARIVNDVEKVEVKEAFICKTCLFLFAEKTILQKHISSKHPAVDIASEMILAIVEKDKNLDSSEPEEILSKESLIALRLIKYLCKICKIPYASKSMFLKHTNKYHPRYCTGDINEIQTNGDGFVSQLELNLKCVNKKPNLKKIDQESAAESDEELIQLKQTKPERRSNRNQDKSTPINKDKDRSQRSLLQEVNNDKSSKALLSSVDTEGLTSKFEHFCKICKVPYMAKRALIRHMEKFHKKDSIISDDQSDSSVRNANLNNDGMNSDEDELLEDDTIQTRDENTFQCKLCKIKYTRKGYFKKHVARYHPDYNEPNSKNLIVSSSRKQRSEVNIDKSRSETLQIHPVGFSAVGTYEYYCKICRMPYELKKNLDRHMEKFHSVSPKETPKDVPNNGSISIDQTTNTPDDRNEVTDTSNTVPENLECHSTTIHIDALQNENLTSTNSERLDQVTNTVHVIVKTSTLQENVYSVPELQNTSTFHSNNLYPQNAMLQDNNCYVDNTSNHYYENTLHPKATIVDGFIEFHNYSVGPRNEGCQSVPITTNQNLETNFIEWQTTMETPSNNLTEMQLLNPELGKQSRLLENQVHISVEELNANENSNNDGCIVLSPGFDINYGSEICDDPEANEKESDQSINNQADQYVDQFISFSQKANVNTGTQYKEDIMALEIARSKGFFCKKCPLYYLRKVFLRNHYVKAHCDCQDLIKELNKEIEEDEKQKLTKNRTSCAICGKKFAQKHNLQRHNEIHVKKPFLCKQCLDCFQTQELLDEHQEKVHGQSKKSSKPLVAKGSKKKTFKETLISSDSEAGNLDSSNERTKNLRQSTRTTLSRATKRKANTTELISNSDNERVLNLPVKHNKTNPVIVILNKD